MAMVIINYSSLVLIELYEPTLSCIKIEPGNKQIDENPSETCYLEQSAAVQSEAQQPQLSPQVS